MTKRFANLRKIPPEPAARMLAMANIKLLTPVAAPASAPVDVVLAELDGKAAKLDVLKLLAVALPAREATWWACLAARDLLGEGVKTLPPPLASAEAWVFKPTDENREAASHAYETAELDDDTAYCAMAALYADGSLGVGDMKGQPAPPNGVAAAVLAMNMIALRARADTFATYMEIIIDRGLDIARGGNGRVTAGAGDKVVGKGAI